jgi:hypothetical protein
MDNPVQTIVQHGGTTAPKNELRSSSTERFIIVVSELNCYAVPCIVVEYPRAAFHLHGVINIKVLRTWESFTIHRSDYNIAFTFTIY